MSVWGLPIACLLGAAGLVWIDGPLSRGLRWMGGQLGGDIRRELETLQQYGAIGSVVIIAIVISVMDPAKRERLWDWLLAMLATAVVVLPMKMLVGRPRPKFDDPFVFLGPIGTYTVDAEKGPKHAWEVWGGISSDLWSMPSSHTAYAVVLSVFLAVTYPKLRGLAWAMMGIVGACRVLFGAHYPSDVLVGAAVAWAISVPIVQGGLGRKWIGARVMDRFGEPGEGWARGVGSDAGGVGSDVGVSGEAGLGGGAGSNRAGG